MKDLKATLGKKDKEADPMEKEAKLSALKGLRDEMTQMMGDGLKDKLNKVTVAAPNKEDLAAGLDKAKEIVAHSPEDEDESGEPSEEPTMSPSMDEEDEDHESDDHKDIESELAEIQARLQELTSLLKK